MPESWKVGNYAEHEENKVEDHRISSWKHWSILFLGGCIPDKKTHSRCRYTKFCDIYAFEWGVDFEKKTHHIIKGGWYILYFIMVILGYILLNVWKKKQLIVIGLWERAASIVERQWEKSQKGNTVWVCLKILTLNPCVVMILPYFHFQWWPLLRISPIFRQAHIPIFSGPFDLLQPIDLAL